MGTAFPACLLIAGINMVLLGCENTNFKKAGETIKETTTKTDDVDRDIGRGISEETQCIVEEISKGANVAVSELKKEGILVSKKGDLVIDKPKKIFQKWLLQLELKLNMLKAQRSLRSI